MRISEMVKKLNKIKIECGDVEVFVSSDEEGNSFATTDATGIEGDTKKVIIYPWHENVTLPA